MSETTANTANIQKSSDFGIKSNSVTSTVTQSTQTTVDMTTTQGTIAEPQVNDKPTKGFDTNNASIPTIYAQRYLSGINKNPLFQENQNGDKYYLVSSLKDSSALTLSFKNEFKRQAENRTSFDQARNFFATLDNKNFKYGRLFFQGNWINTRTPIDPATGEATGLPEMLPA